MARLFDIDKSKIILNPDVLAIPALKKIWDRDKTKDKEKAMKELSYIVFLCDFHSPYKDLRSDEKEKIIKNDIFGDDNWKGDKSIEEAIEIYNRLQITPSMRMLQSSKIAVEKVAKWFEEVDLTKEDGFGKLLYSATDVSRNLKEIGSIVKSIASLEKQVKTELTEVSVRGNNTIGYFEDPDESDEINTAFEFN